MKITYNGSRFYFSVDDRHITQNTDPFIISFFKQGGKKKHFNDQQYVASISRSDKEFKRFKYHGFANVTNAKKLLNDFIKEIYENKI